MYAIDKSKAVYIKLRSFFVNKFQTKIYLIALFGVCLTLSFTLAISYSSINKLYDNSSSEIDKGLESVNDEYLYNYIEITKQLVETKFNEYFQEQAMTADIYQKIMDNENEFLPLTNTIKNIPFFQDKLSFNGNWYQNSPDEPTTVLVEKYLLDKNLKIKPEVQKEIDRSAILDLILPSVYNHGSKKLWTYFQGAKNEEFLRIAPWNNAGGGLDKVYPEFTNKPLWQAFNPGLVEDFENRIKNDPTVKNDLSKLAIVKSPVQDGGTGKIVMTLSHPLWNKERTKFEGSIGFDIDLDEIINYTKNLRLGKTGFAFISQSNGNIFAVNGQGEKILGLKSTAESTIKGNNGAEFNPMLRFIKDSTYSSIKNINLPKDAKIHKSNIKINGVQYILLQQNLSPFNAWNKDKGFYSENWTLGFVVPRAELFGTYNNVRQQISATKSDILHKQIIISIGIIAFLLIIIYLFTNQITVNLKKLQQASIEIKNGNYNVNLNVNSNDEFGSLADTIKRMVFQVNSNLQRLKDQNIQLKIEIENRINKERIIKRLEEIDTLTNLPNLNVLNSKLKEYTSDNLSGTIAIIGMDDFRKVNDVIGREGGSEVLKIISQRLKDAACKNDELFKVDGDEFVLVCKENANAKDIMILAEQILNLLKKPIFIKGKEVFTTASMGIVSFPCDSKDPNLLIKYASQALNRAKENKKGRYQFYNEGINKAIQKRMEMANELRHAILNNEFELFYQPQIDLQSEKIIGMEALIRWNNKLLGNLMPDTFIPLAEDVGLMDEIGQWVLFNACKQTKKWHDMGFKDLMVAVNVSPIQFNENLMELIDNILIKTSLPAEYLEIEVTESLFINNIDKVANILNNLRKKSINVAVDDFGTGYSCLSYIRKLPIDKLKIDRSFIQNIPYEDNGALAATIIEMGKNFGLKITAEGVETKQQKEFLINKKCDQVQGYYYSKPLNILDFTNKLKQEYKY
ncbi:MAG: hypothetical protein K0R54_363 [Clostridiaceae bacterium]|jgi:diguanylate cyclase (GGDEF)-like protein|nr:hypothetical protein [Clostridiaceae bacterium]